ncbi:MULTISPECIES: protein-L-isoaspartate(D-aspartate) O-methyltransferase [Marinobacter]|jgi:protein-L-isoaspartate(D-aspartate) O-methyltransferase|uniref:Protein-L-isoaspartate O-methyltransferase n=2 Tax=Marinobacter TaxID=2742 RepID=A0A137S5U3_9GAMM|nr:MULTISPECIES: protein-L-isoaspartate(D-aspartate) O-methyltransferase [Marinobacter]WBU40283.1 protein-L-isoaspartate(D-aspartate) O-methyltransferase [Marinobacter alkaliphilus]KXO07810.1 Protein-L-isoaspartate O-methyltransferase [Marinobacter excellens LAMA 842]MAO14814.1 protein-L-isoaspartate(D-aspartate) O-methyltransferase [Marinobacter sp.]MCD1629056.1 protein-L-isoaspartate(D-aspartate) O-methyltransferase [Marinobacter shengliensis]PSF12726.1 protein-L-isoaspartate(D-aspartate) O-
MNERVPDFNNLRADMVRYQLAGRGIFDSRVLEAMDRVPRERFIPEHLAGEAYEDYPLPIGWGQTISQPYIVALMAQALQLEGRERVLDIGTGSGYAAAVLASLALEVFSIERIPELAEQARRNLERAGFSQVHVRCGDGTLGWPEAAPFDGICVAAGAPAVPETLKQQLAVGGRLIIPVGSEHSVQRLVCITRRTDADFEREDFGDVRFVPLLGEQGWS